MRLAIILLILAVGTGLLVLNHDAGEVMGMDSGAFARMVSLTTVALAIGTGVLWSSRLAAGRALMSAAVWFVIAFTLVAGYSMKDRILPVLSSTWGALVPGVPVATGVAGEVRVHRAADGHFLVKARADGHDITFLVDTGASSVILTDRDARTLGIETARLRYDVPISTANGRTTAAEVQIGSIEIGEIRLRRVTALVAQPGQLNRSLLGNTALSRLSSFLVEGSTLTLRQ